MGSELEANVVQSFTRAGSWGGSGGRDPPSQRVAQNTTAEKVPS
jgi:hypothetical protein